MDFDFIVIDEKYVSINYDSYNPSLFTFELVDRIIEDGYEFYLTSKNDLLGEYRFYTNKFTKFDGNKHLVVVDKLSSLIKDTCVKYENYGKIKLTKTVKTKDFLKIQHTIKFLENLLEKVKDDDTVFKNIGDFIKYLEE